MIRNRWVILVLLTGLNFFNYLDRLIVAAVLPRIKDDLGLSNTEAGLLATVFLAGYFVTSPLFGVLGDRMARKWLIAAGVLTWSLATVGSGLATNLWLLILARAVVGIGEASYATLAPTIIDDVMPAQHKGKALAIFFLAIPVGGACGYLFGGFVQSMWGWRAAFFLGGGPGLVLALTVLLIAEPARKLETAKADIAHTIGKLFRIPLYRRAVLGYCAHTATIGAFSYWAPTFLSERFADALSPATWTTVTQRAELILAKANFLFGLVTVVAGAVGTILGGFLVDRALRGLPTVPADAPHDDPRNRRAANAQLQVCALGVAVACPLAIAAFVAPSALWFFVFAGLCEVGLFLSTAPINAIMLRTAPVVLRASAMAVGIFAIHLLGDLWSPTLVGVLLDYVVPTLAMMALPVGIAIATLVWWPRAHEAP
ncbi:MAG TPA: MFS transporter [Kofleriaceae bacterium]|nr:MFS transporter [Kofleriaceae bacterium]